MSKCRIAKIVLTCGDDPPQTHKPNKKLRVPFKSRKDAENAVVAYFRDYSAMDRDFHVKVVLKGDIEDE